MTVAPADHVGGTTGAVPVVDRAAVQVAAATAALALALSSTGALVVACAALGVSAWSRRCGVAAVVASLAVSVRFGTAVFDDLAGIQSVLGPAGVVGPEVAAASTWAAAAAVLLAAGDPSRAPGDRARSRPVVLVQALAAGAVAAAFVAGPGPDDLVVRAGATVAAALVAALIAATDRWAPIRRHRPSVAVLVAVASLVAAAWPS